MSKPTDEQLLQCLNTSGRPTYVVKNWLNQELKFRGIKTDWVRRQLFRLEKLGKVVRVPSNYAVMICWKLAEAHHE